MANANIFTTTLTENCTGLVFTNMVTGQSATWIVKNHAGSAVDNTFATISVNGSTLGSSNKLFPGGEVPQWTDSINAVDMYTFFWDGASIYVMVGGLNFS